MFQGIDTELAKIGQRLVEREQLQERIKEVNYKIGALHETLRDLEREDAALTGKIETAKVEMATRLVMDKLALVK